MEASDRDRVVQIFEQALALQPGERSAFIDTACSGDEALRSAVLDMLTRYDDVSTYFNRLFEEVPSSWPAQPPSSGMATGRGSGAASGPVDPTRLTGATIRHYRVGERLGGGGMGVVYQAEDTRLKRTVALKFLPPLLSHDETFRRRFIAEAQAASALDHPNICTIFEVGESEAGQAFIAMAYYEGETLRRRIERGALPIDEAVDIAVQISRGLAKAHERGIVHRDVKPANVMLTPDGIVKVLDFGLAKIADARLTKTQTMLGTAAYMSPEQARSEPVGPHTDIWALGVVLYEMLTAQLPFKGDYEHAVVYAVLNERPTPVAALRPDVPSGLAEAVTQALSKDPGERYPTMEAFREAIVQGASGSAVPVAPAVPSGFGSAVRPATGASMYRDGMGRVVGRPAVSSERRQVSVLFCTLSAAGSQPWDPEALLDVLPAYQEACEKVFSRFDGQDLYYPGEGMMVYFGYPQAHEDDAHRAVRAGLGMIEAVERMNAAQRSAALRLEMRIGIHTGLVVVESGSAGTPSGVRMIGQPVDFATRLQSLALPQTLVVSDDTHRLIEGYFDTEPLEPQVPWGMTEPIAAHRVLHESGARNRFDASAGELTPLVGREVEANLLLGLWEQVREGLGQAVLLRGEAGIGKSRLVEMLKAHVADDPAAWLTQCQCSPYYQHTALYPVIELLTRNALEIRRDAPAGEKRNRLEGFVAQYGLSTRDDLPILADLLSIPLGEHEPSRLRPERQHQRILQILQDILTERAAQQPLLLVVEDLHWADPTTLELLTRVVESIPTGRIYALFTCRPEFEPPWSARVYMTQVTLRRLSRRKVEEMVDRLSDGVPLPEEVLDQIVVKTDGVPLFVEEVTKLMLESGLLLWRNGRYVLDRPLPEVAIPSTLQGSLMARLDRLGVAREVAQLGATIGREFSADLLRAISPMSDSMLRDGLEQLVEAEMVVRKGRGPDEGTYLFRHALIQDVAYDSLLKSTRQQYHRRVVDALEGQFPETVEIHPELLAHHCTQAGLTARAVPYWKRAGERALARSAHVEAVDHLRKGLSLLETLPESEDRAREEIELQIRLGAPLTATKGYGAPEVEQAYGRARALSQQVGATPQLVPALYGLWRFYLLRADYAPARELAERLLGIAEQEEQSVFLVAAHRAMGSTLFYLGAFAEAERHLDALLAYDPGVLKNGPAELFDVVDAWTTGHAYRAWTRWMLGRPDAATVESAAAIARADAIKHPFSQALAHGFGAWLEQFRGEADRTLDHADHALMLSNRYAFQFWVGWDLVLKGWALAARGLDEEGLRFMREGLPAWRGTGSELGTAYFLALIADVHLRRDEPDAADRALDEAFEIAERTGEQWWMPEMHRLRALAHVARGEDEPAEAAFAAALAAARRNDARTLELRVLVSLHRFRRAQAADADTLPDLAECYSAFTEGLDTADLQAAREILEGGG